MPILVLPPRFTPDTLAMSQAAQLADWSVERLPSWRVPDWLRGCDVVLYGEPLFAAVVADDLGIALLQPPFDWLPKIPLEYRQRDVRFATLGEARRIRQSRFIKPADDKCFLAGVVASGAELPGDDVLPDATPVLVAEPVSWEVEFRAFILERQTMAISPYLRFGQLAQSPDGSWQDERTEQAAEYVRCVTSDLSIPLPPAVVLDVGIIEESGWAVVETNAAWGSGIYGCNPRAVLDVVRRACVPVDRVSPEDCSWLIDRMAIETDASRP